DEFALPFMGDEVVGDVSALQYSAALTTPKNEAFVKTYRTKYGKVPSYTTRRLKSSMKQSRRLAANGRVPSSSSRSWRA
ncbi:MAG: hypothetical protein ACM3IH_09150, partial [Sphingobacteriales bacterium]